MFGALRVFVAHELGSHHLALVAPLARTTSLISCAPLLDAHWQVGRERKEQPAPHLAPDAKNRISVSPLAHCFASTAPPGGACEGWRPDRRGGGFGGRAGIEIHGKNQGEWEIRGLSGGNGKSGSGHDDSQASSNDPHQAASKSEGGGDGEGARTDNHHRNQSLEDRVNARLINLMHDRLSERVSNLKATAKSLAQLKTLDGDLQAPIIMYSPSLYWADDAFGMGIRALAKFASRLQAALISRFVEPGFSESEFLEGCKDAAYIVNHHFGEQDWEGLKPMISKKLLDVYQAVEHEFKLQGLSFSLTTEYVKDAFIQGFFIADAHHMARFDEDLFKVGEEADVFWEVISVRMLTKDRFKVFKTETSALVSDALHQREETWTFVRGPLKELPLQNDDTGWTLLSVS